VLHDKNIPVIPHIIRIVLSFLSLAYKYSKCCCSLCVLHLPPGVSHHVTLALLCVIIPKDLKMLSCVTFFHICVIIQNSSRMLPCVILLALCVIIQNMPRVSPRVILSLIRVITQNQQKVSHYATFLPIRVIIIRVTPQPKDVTHYAIPIPVILHVMPHSQKKYHLLCSLPS